jgi:hypothetical protein
MSQFEKSRMVICAGANVAKGTTVKWCDSIGIAAGPGATTPSDAAIELDPNIMDVENRLPATFDYREPMVNTQVLLLSKPSPFF